MKRRPSVSIRCEAARPPVREVATMISKALIGLSIAAALALSTLCVASAPNDSVCEDLPVAQSR
jgi:hypothetical protein